MYKGRKNIKIKSFFDHEEHCVNPGGSTYITCTWAKDQAEEFINTPGIDALDIQFDNRAVYVIYRRISYDHRSKRTI